MRNEKNEKKKGNREVRVMKNTERHHGETKREGGGKQTGKQAGKVNGKVREGKGEQEVEIIKGVNRERLVMKSKMKKHKG